MGNKRVHKSVGRTKKKKKYIKNVNGIFPKKNNVFWERPKYTNAY